MMYDNTQKSVEERLLDAFYYEPKVFWTLGGNGAAIQIFTEFEDKINLFDLSFYEDQENDPTVRYLKEHSVKDIFAGKNPDMVPEKVCIVEGGDGIIEINFRCSKELQVAGVDDRFLLNRDLEDARFGVTTKGSGSEKYVVGYTKSEKQEPYVKTYYENGVTSLATFTIASSY